MKKRSFTDLSTSYRRSIATRLSLLDEEICEFEDLAKGREIQSILYSVINRLLPEQRKAMLAEVAKIRGILVQLKDELQLEEHVQSAAEFIWSHCSALWASLSEIDSERLKGYGGAPPGFPEYWDPKLAQLGKHLERILEILRES